MSRYTVVESIFHGDGDWSVEVTTNPKIKVLKFTSSTKFVRWGLQALAWHPWMTGLLCIGGGPGDGSLSLWNVNTQSQLGYRKIRFVGCVDTLLFNELSGELVVHWFYLDNDRLHSKIVVMASLDKVVDAVPIQPGHKILNVLWNPDQTKLGKILVRTYVACNFLPR